MKNKKIYLSIILSVSILCFIILLDLLTKHFIIVELIPKVGDSIDVIPGFINFIYVKNTGAAWGMLAGRPIFLIIISIIILGIYIWFYVLRIKKLQNKVSKVLSISVGLIAGGCIGNLVDRIAFGYVRDFINFEFMNFPVFNFADVALTFGIILMVIYFLFIFSKEDDRKKVKQGNNNVGENEQVNIDLSNLTNEPIGHDNSNEDEHKPDKNENIDNKNEKVNDLDKNQEKASNSKKGE